MRNQPQSIELQPGDQVRSKRSTYTVEKALGTGGFGSVYLVNGASVHYALKLTKLFTFLPNERVEFAKRFKQEYEYGSNLQSKFVVKSYDYDLLDGNPYLVMDLCPNGSLRDYVNKAVNDNTLDRIAFGILTGLSDLHREGIIHRDVKPENVLFDDENRPKLADFGISASVKKRHTVANFMGHAKEVFATGAYSPPEQFDPKRAIKVMGPGNDIYAFGVMMYEVITHGGLPFGTFEEFMEDMVAYEKKKKAESWNRELLRQNTQTEKWYRIIEKCIRYEPADRYRQADEILRELGFQPNRPEYHHEITPQSRWMLKVQNGEEIGRVYNLSRLRQFNRKDQLTVGWFNEDAPFTNDIGLAEHFTQFISSYHATLRYNAETYYWEILDGQLRQKHGMQGWYPSTNGVLVNGNRVNNKSTVLNPDDIITIGDTTLKVVVA